MKANEKQKTTDRFTGVEHFLDGIDGIFEEFEKKTQSLTSEAQLQAHLGIMGAESTWSDSKKKLIAAVNQLRQAQRRPTEALTKATEEFNQGLHDAEVALSKLRRKLNKTGDDVSALTNAAGADAKAALRRVKDAYQSIKSTLLQ